MGNQATALATEPICRSSRKIFKKYELWKGGRDVVDNKIAAIT